MRLTLNKSKLHTYAADKRWQLETGGITVSGIQVATDDRSKMMIMGARMAAQNKPSWSTKWVGKNGTVHTVNAAAVTTMSDAVQEHVNKVFTAYDGIKAQIEAGSLATPAQIDAAFAIALAS